MADQKCVLVFDGQDDYVNIPHSNTLNVDAVTIELWFQWDKQGNTVDFLCGKANEELEIHIGGDGGTQGIRFIPTAGVYIDTGDNKFKSKEWVHVAAVYDASQSLGKVYVNGVDTQAVLHGYKPITTPITKSTSDLLLGVRYSKSFYFQGKMAEVRVWNKARTQTEIQQDMKFRLTGNEPGLVAYLPINECSSSTVNDKTANGNHGTIHGATWQQEEPPVQAKTSQLIKQGTQGSTIKGTVYDIQPKPEASQNRIKSVRVKGGWAVDSIQVQYETLGTPAETYLSTVSGGKGGNLAEFSLDHDDYLTEIIGSWGTGAPGYPKQEIVTLQFKTYKGVTSPVIGGGNPKKDVEPFSLKAPPDHEIIGFFGEHGNTLYNIGIYLQTAPQATKTGKIVVNADEWTLSNTGFTNAPDTAIFANNIAKWFAGDRAGKFHAYSTNFGLTQSTLAETLQKAGHTWTTGTNITFDLPTLLTYDGIFVGADAANNQVLIDYVKAGGNVYVMAGTGAGGAQGEADLWNTFLNAFGFKFLGEYTGSAGNQTVNNSHPILAGVKALYQNYGNSIVNLDSTSGKNQLILIDSSAQGLIATFEGTAATLSKFVKVGTKGGAIAGQDFDFQPKDTASRLKKVGILSAWAISAFEVEYENPTSNPAETYRLGPVGGGGGEKAEVSIEPGDYLTKVTGTWGRQAPGYPKEEIITLQFETHKGFKSAVFGGGSRQQEVEPFVLEAPEGHEIIGFFGSHGGPQNLIIRLGIYCQPVKQPVTPEPITTDEGDPEKLIEEFVEEEKTVTATGTVAIADLSYKGKVKRTQSDEYVEIVNKGIATVDISGWKISSGLSKRQAFTFPAKTTLEAGKSCRVYTNEVRPETGGFTFGSGSGIWNDKGDEAKLFDAQGNQVSTLAYGASGIPGIKAELGVPQLTIKVSPSAINKQMAMGSKVTFIDALQLAIRSFLEDGNEIESPLGQILNDPSAFGLSKEADKAAATKLLRSYLNQPTSSLTLLTAKSEYPAENGEKIDSNWIFLLQLKEISGLYWVIIDRSGAKVPYNYGVS